jgi:hypothetical protein
MGESPFSYAQNIIALWVGGFNRSKRMTSRRGHLGAKISRIITGVRFFFILFLLSESGFDDIMKAEYFTLKERKY